MSIGSVIVDGGFFTALVQKNRPSQIDYSTAFHLNLITSLILYTILFLISKPISNFYEEPSLELLIRIVGFNIIFASFTVVQRAIFTRNNDFKTQTKCSLIAATLSGIIGVLLAISGTGVWALVLQYMINSILLAFFLWHYSNWSPQFIISKDSFRSLFNFSGKILLSGIVHSIFVNTYTFIIGKQFSTQVLGYYNRANNLAQFPSFNLTNIFNRAFFPVQCQVTDTIESRQLFERYLLSSVLIIFPVMCILYILSDSIVVVLLSDKWLSSAVFIRYLSVGYVIYPIIVVNNSILNVKGRSDYFLYSEIASKLLGILLLVLAINEGINYVLLALIGYYYGQLVIVLYFARRVIGTSLLAQLRIVMPVLLACVFPAVLVMIILSFIDVHIYKLLVGLPLWTLIYLLILGQMKVISKENILQYFIK